MFSEFFTPAGQKQIDKNLKKSVFNLYSENKTKIDQRKIKMRLRMLLLRNENLSDQAWLTWMSDNLNPLIHKVFQEPKI